MAGSAASLQARSSVEACLVDDPARGTALISWPLYKITPAAALPHLGSEGHTCHILDRPSEKAEPERECPGRQCFERVVPRALGLARIRPKPGLEIARIESPRKLTRSGVATLLILAATILLWLTSGIHGVSPGVVALLAAVSLTVFGILDRDDVDSRSRRDAYNATGT